MFGLNLQQVGVQVIPTIVAPQRGQARWLHFVSGIGMTRSPHFGHSQKLFVGVIYILKFPPQKPFPEIMPYLFYRCDRCAALPYLIIDARARIVMDYLVGLNP